MEGCIYRRVAYIIGKSYFGVFFFWGGGAVPVLVPAKRKGWGEETSGRQAGI